MDFRPQRQLGKLADSSVIGSFAILSRLRASVFADLPDSIKLHEVGLDPDVLEICGQKVSGSEKFGTVMFSLGVTVSFEMRQAPIGGAVGMAHNQDPFGRVQAD